MPNVKFFALAGCLILLAGCRPAEEETPSFPPPAVEEPTAPPSWEPPSSQEEVNVARRTAREIWEELRRPGMGEAEKIQAAYEWLISSTSFAQPVGLDIWRYRGQSQPPDYLENRALSPLLFGLGSCEDYAAALTVLLQEMGFEAVYVAGLTISVEGDFVDHAWTAVRLRGEWYHLDAQLEDNILQNDFLTYRYFLRSDKTMLADHRWGENLLGFAAWMPKQQEEILQWMPPEECSVDFPTPSPKRLQQAVVSRQQVQEEISQEKQAYIREHGSLPPLELNTTPPVFGGEEFHG